MSGHERSRVEPSRSAHIDFDPAQNGLPIRIVARLYNPWKFCVGRFDAEADDALHFADRTIRALWEYCTK